jgi:hypothetical protein
MDFENKMPKSTNNAASGGRDIYTNNYNKKTGSQKIGN